METIPEKKQGHLFTVDILMEGHSNGIALEKLIQLLNSDKIVDYRITNGITLGKVIEVAEKAANNPKAAGNAKSAQNPKSGHAAKSAESLIPAVPAKSIKPEINPIDVTKESLLTQIDQYKKNNTLLRLSVVKGLGVLISMPCRILNYDEEDDNISVYHVDEKMVYQFNLNEIDDITPH